MQKNKGLIFDRFFICSYIAEVTGRLSWIKDEFWSMISFSLRAFLPIFRKQFLYFFLFDGLLNNVYNILQNMSRNIFFRRKQKTERVSVRIQSECGKIRTRKNSVFGQFSRCETMVKPTFFSNFAKTSKGPHFTIQVCRILEFCDIVEFWNTFENSFLNR